MKKIVAIIEIWRAVKYRVAIPLREVLKIISPAYRVALRNEQILTRMHLLLEDVHEKNMSVYSGERQTYKEVADIEPSHLKRYQFAKTLIKDGDEVLDIACGVGYGSYVMAENKNANFTAVDISTGAIEHANKHFKRDNIEFICSPAETFEPEKKFDVMISFETIEHLRHDKVFIGLITKHLKQGGLFICSTPNELNVPHSILSTPFHYRHYTPRQMTRMLKRKGGLKTEAIYTQRKSNDYELTKSGLGIFTIHVARKK